ncbi:threonine/serine exporter family protein [Bacillus massiliigorillae]|uniref:threonine/serine exporter family protein n=1 Tax=Bacillus massiliigorillae TaxID=1243664 RepID=UPI0003A3ABF1|nr:threonine/serine exporter family protein [Bacillus massiliigorillae]
MEYLAQLVTSFIGSAGFGIIFNVPRETVLKCGFVGMSGWICYFILSQNGVDIIPATAMASTLIAVISQLFAKIYKTPMTIFTVGGIIPLVPGGMAYNAMRHFVENDYNTAISLAAKAFLISGSIAIGLVFSEVLHQIIKRIKYRKKMV